MTNEQLKRLKARAHLHTDACYGEYQVCGEHHRHTNSCGGKPLICHQNEDKDLAALFSHLEDQGIML